MTKDCELSVDKDATPFYTSNDFLSLRSAQIAAISLFRFGATTKTSRRGRWPERKNSTTA
jgi:hypothetical protein